MALTDVYARVTVSSSLQAMRDAYPDARPEPVTAAVNRNGRETR